MIRNNKESHLSLPPNYLTLAQLRERWLKEKQQGKQEEEEVKATEQRENEDKERQKREDQENRYENGETSQEPSKTVPRRRPFRPNRRGKRSIAFGGKEQEPVESRIEEVAVNDSERKSDGSKKKKLWVKMKARAENGRTGGTEQPLPGEVPKGESAEAVVKGDVEKVMKGTEIKRNGGDMRVHGSNWEEEATVGGSDEIGRKLEVLSLDGERRGDRRSAGNVYRDHFTHKRGSEDKERQKREDQENRYENGETSQEPSKTVPRRRPFRPNRRGKRLIAFGVKEQEPVESRIEEVAVNDSERKSDGSKKKKLWVKMKARAENGRTGVTEQPLPGEVPKGESAEAVVKGDVEKVMEGTEIKRNGGDMRVHGSNWEEEATVGGSDEMGRKLEVLSLDGERRGDRRSAGNVYRDHFTHKRGSAGFNLSKIQKPKESKLVWVRKGEPSDVNLAQSS